MEWGVPILLGVIICAFFILTSYLLPDSWLVSRQGWHIAWLSGNELFFGLCVLCLL